MVLVQVYSQNYNSFPLNNLTEDDGLPSNEVYHAIQDKMGYIWFATENGIAKYNGITIERYDSNDGLPVNTVYQLYLQEDGSIVGECAKNQYFTISNDSIIPFSINERIVETIPYVKLSHSYYLDNKNQHHFGTRNGEFVFDNKGTLLEADTISLKSDHKIIKYKTIQDYVFTYCIRSFKSYSYITIEELDANGKVKTTSEFETDKILFDHSTYGVILDDSSVAINHWNFVIIYRGGKVEQIIKPDYDPVKVNKINNQLWVSTLGEGVLIYEKNIDQYELVGRILDGYSITSVMESSNEIIWFTSREQGVFYLNLNSPQIRFESEKKINISCFYKDEEIEVIGMENGELNVNGTSIICPANRPVTSINKIGSSIIVSANNDYFLENPNTLILKESPWSLTRAPHFSELEVLSDSLLIGYSYTNFSILNIYTNEIQAIPDKTFNDKIIEAQLFDNQVYISTASHIYIIDPFNETALDKIRTQSTIIGFFQYCNSIYGLSQDGHVYRIYQGNLRPCNLPIPEIVSRFFSVFAYNDKLYISTDKGIFIWAFNSTTKLLEVDGFINVKNVINMQMYNDTLYFFNKNKVFSTSIKDNDLQKPDVRIHSIEINQQLKPHSNMMSLAYNENDIVFRLETISLDQQFQNFKYKLEGHDPKYQTTESNYISYNSLQPGDYSLKYSGTSDGYNYSAFQTFQFTIFKPFWLSYWFITLCSLFLLAVVLSIYKIRIRRIKNILLLEKTIIDLKSKALAAQLNPHLIYNVLNSIQGIIAEGDSKIANSYVSKFSRFMRSSLIFSKRQSVSLKEEIEITKQYMELEKLRFDDEIHFSLKNETPRAENIMVPPLIIQPLIENAIKHGIMPTLEKNGVINITIKEETQYLTILVEDNGIGIKQGVVFGDGLNITLSRLKNLDKKNDLTLQNSTIGAEAKIKLTIDP